LLLILHKPPDIIKLHLIIKNSCCYLYSCKKHREDLSRLIEERALV
jgi:hypothetical protein